MAVVKTVVVDPILVGIGEFTTHFSLPILVVGLGCSLGVRGFDPWPYIYIYIHIHIYVYTYRGVGPFCRNRHPRMASLVETHTGVLFEGTVCFGAF